VPDSVGDKLLKWDMWAKQKKKEKKEFNKKRSRMHTKLRGFLLPCDLCLWTIYLEIVWAYLQYKTNATFQTVLEKQDTWITTSKPGETPSFPIKHLDTSCNFEAV